MKTEFRIGNLFNQFGYIHEVSADTLKDLSSAPSSQLWCKPIPLAEEELNKFDWQLIRDNNYYINSYFSIDNVGHLYYGSDYTGVNLNYVHELQNFAFLINKEELNVITRDYRLTELTKEE
jgi:hypothetical protein